jgi:polyphosphate kinase 2 (PPK2 family)
VILDSHDYVVHDDDDDDPILLDANGIPVDTWRENYPYDERMKREEYEEQKRLLQIELLKLQKWSQAHGHRHVVVFEGRDAAGKGGTIKRWFSVSPSEQRTRFTIRQVDPVRQWKLSPTDLASLDKWDAYTAAKEDMFAWTDTEIAPWMVVKSNDKKRARVNAMRYVLSKFDYDNKDHEVVGRPDPLIVGRALND